VEPGILHVDMDAFYASVEVRDAPELAGRPVIVGGRPDARGVVSAASYEARAYGVRSAMPLVRAARLCPDGVFLPLRMESYAEASERIFSIFREYTPLVEGLSFDEAFLDVRGSRRLFGSGPEIGRRIRDRIASEVGLACSVGVAPVKFVAKIASDLEKPNGFVVVTQEELTAFLDRLPVERLWGVGEVMTEKLRHLGITSVGQVRACDPAFLEEHFKESGRHIARLARGEDPRPVVPGHRRKSLGHETTFPEDVGDRDLLLAALLDIVEEVGHRARKGGHRARTVVLKVRYAPFETHTMQSALSAPTDNTDEIYEAARALFTRSVRVPPRKVRLLGVTLTALGGPSDRQMSLFTEERRRRSERLDETVDRIRDRLGRGSIRRAGTLGARRRPKEK
jgi:DNA polymerase-4